MTTGGATSGSQDRSYAAALDTAVRLLRFRLERFLQVAPSEPAINVGITKEAIAESWS